MLVRVFENYPQIHSVNLKLMSDILLLTRVDIRRESFFD